MGNEHDDLRFEVERLAGEVRSLAERVSSLEAARQEKTAQVRTVPSTPPPEEAPARGGTPLSVGGMTALFSRFAAVSLILVFALVLRTITDRGMIHPVVGSLLGLAYASLLEGTGWLMYHRRHAFASIFTVSGAVLVFSVILETHTRFGALSSLGAYLLILVAAAGMAVVSHWKRVALPVAVGVIGALMAGIPLDFPEPNFTMLAFFLLAVNLMAFSAANLQRCRWLRMATFGATATVYLGWAFKVGAALRSGGKGAHPLFATSLPWLLVLTAAFFVAASFIRLFGRRERPVSMFDATLPSMACAWAYLLYRMHLPTGWWSVNKTLGGFGAGASLLLFALALLLIRRHGGKVRGTNTFVFPSAVLLAVSFRDLSGESVLALAVLSAAALGLLVLSRLWGSGGVRVTSYILSVMVAGALFILLLPLPSGDLPSLTLISTLAIAVVSFLHYRQARATSPPSPSMYFERVDRRDRGGLVPFLASLASSFLFLRAAAHGLLSGPSFGGGNAFSGAQSIIINLGASVLFLKAYRGRSTEVRTVAILVTLIGALKVFISDLFSVQDVPLVLSVLSFGLAAALGSVVLGRWQRHDADRAE